MSQFDFGTINPATKDGNTLASDLNSWRTAINSAHKGATQPTYRIAGIKWVDDTGTPWILKRYDGADWVIEGWYNATTNQFDSALGGNVVQSLTAAQRGVVRSNISAALKGQRYGLVLTNDPTDAANDIGLAVGEAASTETDPVLMVLASAMIGRADGGTWVVGTNQPKLDTGTIANSTYAVWLIQRSDTGVTDMLMSLSFSAPTMPASYDRKRLIGQFTRAAAVNDGPWSFSIVGPKLGKVQATTSGTAKTYTIPSGTKRIKAMFAGVSSNATGGMVIKLGDAGGLEVTGYNGSILTLTGGANTSANLSTQFGLATGTAASVFHGDIELTLVDPATNMWEASWALSRSDAAALYTGSGTKALSQELTTIELSANGDTFDAGSWNIMIFCELG